jgi:hypothetical protein
MIQTGSPADLVKVQSALKALLVGCWRNSRKMMGYRGRIRGKLSLALLVLLLPLL